MNEDKFDLKTFIDNYYPDNHWLSKSMEIMKQGYGTYWYLKKMLVYYYYIFINKKLSNKEFKQINNIFITYIKSLPINIQAEARNFFYVIDFRDASFISFNEFISTTESFDDYESELLKARKYYYSYVMNLKGQNNKKAKILNIVIEERNYFKGINKARNIIVDNFVQLSNDVHSFLRNERQILFLMGLLNYTENRGVEEYAPTEVGLIALLSNNEELILLMELQKIKQVSRNPLVFYSYNPERQRNRQMKEGLDSSLGEGVAIKTHPYFFLLKFLNEKGRVDMEKYRYFLARVNDNHKENELFSINFDNIMLELNKRRGKREVDAEQYNTESREIMEQLDELFKQRDELITEQSDGALSKSQCKMLKDFLKKEQKQSEFDKDVFTKLVEKIIVNSREDITFIFKDGTEVKAF